MTSERLELRKVSFALFAKIACIDLCFAFKAGLLGCGCGGCCGVLLTALPD